MSQTKSLNDLALESFVHQPVTQQMVDFLAMKAREVIQCEDKSNFLPPTPPTTPPNDDADCSRTKVYSREDPIPSLEEFISALCTSSNVQVPTLMTTLLYLHRLRSRLPPVAKGLPCTVHRIFLACLILSAKFLNDASPKNKHWAHYTQLTSTFGFKTSEVNLMEKQLLFLLDWDLNFTQSELQYHFEPFLAPIRENILNKAERKRTERLAKQKVEEKRERQRLALQASKPKSVKQPSYSYPIVVEQSAKSKNYQSASSTRHPYYNQALSTPPSLSEIPALSRSGTYDSSRESSRSRSRSQSRSHSRSNTNTSARTVEVVTPNSSTSSLAFAHENTEESGLSVDELYTDLYGSSGVWRAGCGASIEGLDGDKYDEMHDNHGRHAGMIDDATTSMPGYETIDLCSKPTTLHDTNTRGPKKRAGFGQSFVGYAGELFQGTTAAPPMAIQQPAQKKARTGGFLSMLKGREVV